MASLGQGAWHAVVETDERVVVAGLAAVMPGLLLDCLPVAGAGPPLARTLSGDRDHSGEQHEQPHGELAGRQGRGERAVGLSHDHQIRAAAGRTGRGARVIIQARRVVVARQVGRDGSDGSGLLADLWPGWWCEAMAMRGRMRLDSYDRLFPSQDLLPAGGIGWKTRFAASASKGCSSSG